MERCISVKLKGDCDGMENILSVERDILEAVVSDFDMDLSDGLYLGHEIVAFSGNWLILSY